MHTIRMYIEDEHAQSVTCSNDIHDSRRLVYLESESTKISK